MKFRHTKFYQNLQKPAVEKPTYDLKNQTLLHIDMAENRKCPTNHSENFSYRFLR
jgi:hypothetical protein